MNEEQIRKMLTGNPSEGTCEERTAAEAFFKESSEEFRASIDLERGFDQQFRQAMREVRAPVSLREAILRERFHAGDELSEVAELSAFGAEAPSQASKTRIFWRPAVYAAAAAVIVLMLVRLPLAEPTTGAEHSTQVAPSSAFARASVGDFVTKVSNFFPQIGPYNERSSDIHHLNAYLAKHGGPTDSSVPERFSSAQPQGCRILTIDGVPVSMICIDGELFMHLFIVPASACGDVDFDGMLDFERGERSFIAWREGENVFMVGARSETESLRTHLKSSFAFTR